MVTITSNTDVAFDMYETGIGSSLSQTVLEIQSSKVEFIRGYSYIEILEGLDFGIDSEGFVTGIANKLTENINDINSFIIEGILTPVKSILAWGEDGDYQAFFNNILVNADTITGSDLDDRIFSGGGNDIIKAGLGDDDIDAGHGYNFIDGEGGYDTLLSLIHI